MIEVGILFLHHASASLLCYFFHSLVTTATTGILMDSADRSQLITL